jgi:hypothetical protein
VLLVLVLLLLLLVLKKCSKQLLLPLMLDAHLGHHVSNALNLLSLICPRIRRRIFFH